MLTETKFLAAIGDAFPETVMLTPESSASAPDAKGAYALAGFGSSDCPICASHLLVADMGWRGWWNR